MAAFRSRSSAHSLCGLQSDRKRSFSDVPIFRVLTMGSENVRVFVLAAVLFFTLVISTVTLIMCKRSGKGKGKKQRATKKRGTKGKGAKDASGTPAPYGAHRGVASLKPMATNQPPSAQSAPVQTAVAKPEPPKPAAPEAPQGAAAAKQDARQKEAEKADAERNAQVSYYVRRGHSAWQPVSRVDDDEFSLQINSDETGGVEAC
ncbi:hypothetical protein M3Y99_00076800 [Aphelenchoides fujianensis]|nr:hypothetical protein M3Y99_00076800 [Aphelenchoides fujianensis]